MQKRKLGHTGIEIAPLAFGGNVFGWTADENTSFSLIDMFIERGYSLIDTADVYSAWVQGHSGGESETIIGKWVKRGGARDKIVLATKVGMTMPNVGQGLSKAHIIKSVENSLKRLGVERIDLYQAHADDDAVPQEETLAAFASLIASGKVGAIGASNFGAPRLASALAVSAAHGQPRFETLQPHYNLANPSLFEGALQELCVTENIGVIPYYSLAGGFLTGKYRSEKDTAGKQRAGTVAPYLNARGFGIVAALDDVAARLGATPAQIALAWLQAQKGITAPIVSATSRAQLDDILRASDIILDSAALEQLNRASA